MPRLCTWGEFQDRAAGKNFFAFNIHFDHRGKKSRLESARLLREQAQKIAEKSPVILMGDFNSSQDSEVHKILVEQKKFSDAFEISPVKLAPTGTFNQFDPDLATSQRIDHLFLSKDFRVEKYGILTDTYRGQQAAPSSRKDKNSKAARSDASMKPGARLPSDHFPVVIEAEWAE